MRKKSSPPQTAPTVQVSLANEIVNDIKKQTDVINAWMIILSDRGKAPRVIQAPKKVQVPLAFLPEGMISFIVEKKKVVAWLPKAKDKIVVAKDLGHDLKPGPLRLKQRLDHDMLWMGGYQKNQGLLFVPLDTGAEIVHILVMEKAVWRSKQIAGLSLFCQLSSRALKVALETRKMEKRLRRSSAISEIAQNINMTLELPILLRLMVLEVTKAMNSLAGNIWLTDPKHNRMTLQVSVGLSEGLKQVLEQTMMPFKIPDKKNYIIIEAVEELSESQAKLFQGTGIQTVLAIPLKTKNKTIGFIQLFSRWTKADHLEDEGLLRTLANLAATVIDNARLFEEAQRKAKELLAVYEVGQVISETANIDKALEHIVERVSDILDVEKCWWMFYRPKTKMLHAHKVAVGAIKEQLDALQVSVDQESISAIVFRSSKPMFSNDAQDLSVVQEEYQGIFKLTNVMAVPMRGSDETIGVFLAANKRGDRAFTSSDVRLFKTLASTSTTVIQHADVYEELEKSNLSMVKIISKTVAAHEPYAQGHSQRVAWYAEAMSRKLNLSKHEIGQIRMAGLLHDIGKLVMTTEDENAKNEHMLKGAEILLEVDFPWEISRLVKHYREHMDGSGFPDGLKGEDIPLGARIIAVVDRFDIAVNGLEGRSHSWQEGLEKIKSLAETQLDPTLVDLFITIWPEIEKQEIAG